MKLTKLILENINSIYGRWELDFTAEAFADGIFAIVGPTGSGKTTILDGMMLALFAETPRLTEENRIECVSKHANSCLAELSFSVGSKKYVARFSYDSYKRGPDKGKLRKDVHHCLAENGEYIAQNTRDTVRKVKEILGMDAKQFCRTVLLAQGKFNEFLRAKDDDKAAILEQITGTRRYAAIGTKVFERMKEAERRLNSLQEQLDAMRLLSTEEEDARRQEQKQLEQQQLQCMARQKTLGELLQALANLDSFQTMLKDNQERQGKLAEEWEQFQPEQERLKLGHQAARLKEAYEERQRETLREQEAREALTTLSQEVLPKKVAADAEARQAEQAALDASTRMQGEAQTLETLFQKVMPLDEQLRTLVKEQQDLQERVDKNQAETAAMAEAVTRQQQERELLKQDKMRAETYLHEHAQDEKLAEKRGLWGAWIKELVALQAQVKLQEQAQKKAELSLNKAQQARHKSQERAKKAQESRQAVEVQIRQRQEQLSQALDGSKRSDLELLLEERRKHVRALYLIADYEEQRKLLEVGRPCPLCGSVEHPFQSQAIPQVTDEEAQLKALEERLKGIDGLREDIAQLQQQLVKEGSLLAQAQLELANCDKDVETAQENLRTCQELLVSIRSKESDRQATLTQELVAAGLVWNGADSLPPELDLRLKQWQENGQKVHEFEQRWEGLEARLQATQERVRELTEAKGELLKLAEAKRELWQNTANARKELFGERQVEEERTHLKHRLTAAQHAVNEVQQKRAQAEEALKQAQAEETRQKTALKQLQNTLQEKREAFQKESESLGMTEAEFLAARLPDEELQRLNDLQTRLIAQKAELKEQHARLESQLAAARQAVPEQVDREQVRQELDHLQEQGGDLGRRLGALTEELKHQEEQLRHCQELRTQAEELKPTLDVLVSMNAMIGGGDGKKFKRFAQRVTLEQLLGAANQKLKFMAPRYALIAGEGGENKELDIDVVDYDQGSEVRTSKNLSGGEQFMVSLALALGLSSMVGERMQVDSLFLDEGFGTLDAKALEMAVGLLTQLRQKEGKNIGIISHIKAIREAFPTVEVIPTGEGRSKLEGPGVKELTVKE